MDFNSIASNSFSTILPFLMSIKDGVLKGIGNDLWKLIKKPFRFDEKDNKIVDELEKNPNDLKLQGIAEFRLAQLLETNQDVAEELIKLIQALNEENQRNGIVNIKNSKNFVIAKDIRIQSGNFTIGDGGQYGK